MCEIKTHNAVCSKREEYEIIGFYKNRVRGVMFHKFLTSNDSKHIDIKCRQFIRVYCKKNGN